MHSQMQGQKNLEDGGGGAWFMTIFNNTVRNISKQAKSANSQ